jgi:CrcB protein
MKGIELLLLSIGALAGAFLRYKIASSPILFGIFPVNTLIVNVLGSFILGIFWALSVSYNLDSKYTVLIAIGFCGTFTTMSTFALESINLLETKHFLSFGLNIITNVGLSLGAIIAGKSVITILMKLLY